VISHHPDYIETLHPQDPGLCSHVLRRFVPAKNEYWRGVHPAGDDASDRISLSCTCGNKSNCQSVRSPVVEARRKYRSLLVMAADDLSLRFTTDRVKEDDISSANNPERMFDSFFSQPVGYFVRDHL
jgi:hypothetical protein